jgi:hypothetical protein
MTTVLVHLENAAEKIGRLLESFQNGDIEGEELQKKINEASPKLPDVGLEVNESGSLLNTKPVPDNPESVVYFYSDDDGTLKATVRIPAYDDNTQLDDDSEATAGQLAACEVLHLVHMEHQKVLHQISLQMAMQQMESSSGEEGDDDDMLSAIEDEDTREQVRKMTKH